MINGNAKNVPRLCPNWIDSFLEYTGAGSSPDIFRKWTAIGVLSGAVERRVWSFTKGAPLYPNCYIVLTGPPGVGKSVPLSKAEGILRKVEKLHVAPSSVTTASLIDTIAASEISLTTIYPVKQDIKFNSLIVVASELGIFMPAYESQFINTLIKLYDGELYEERRRKGKKEHTRIDSPSLTILGGTTPAYLNGTLPDGAWDQGFTSRTIFIFHGDETLGDIFGESEGENRQLQDLLIKDLNAIRLMYGKMTWTKAAMSKVEAWNKSGRAPVPEHGKLLHYNSRRLAHLLKLSMVASIAENNSMEITLEHVEVAFNWLFEAEHYMPDIFKSMGISEDARAMQDLHYYVMKLAAKSPNKMVSEHILVGFLRDRVPSHSVMRVLDVMVNSRDLKKHFVDGRPWYTAEVKVPY